MRGGILSSVGASGDAELDDEVTKATKEELEAGWLLGRHRRGCTQGILEWVTLKTRGTDAPYENYLRESPAVRQV